MESKQKKTTQRQVSKKQQEKVAEEPQKGASSIKKNKSQEDEKKQQQLFGIILKLIQEYQNKNQKITRKQLRQSLQANFEKKDIEKQIQMIQRYEKVYFEQVDKDICYSLRDDAVSLKNKNLQEHLELIVYNLKKSREQGNGSMWNSIENGMREDYFLQLMKQQNQPYLLIKQNLKVLKKQKKIIRQKDCDVFLLKEYLNENEQKIKQFVQQQLENQIFVQRQLRKMTSSQFLQNSGNKQQNNRIYKKILGEIPVTVRSIFEDNKFGGKKYIFLKENQFFFEEEYLKGFQIIYQKLLEEIQRGGQEFSLQQFCEQNKFEFAVEDLIKYYNINNPNSVQLKKIKKTRAVQSKKNLNQEEIESLLNKIKQLGSLEQDQIYSRLQDSKQIIKMNNIIGKLI